MPFIGYHSQAKEDQFNIFFFPSTFVCKYELTGNDFLAGTGPEMTFFGGDRDWDKDQQFLKTLLKKHFIFSISIYYINKF